MKKEARARIKINKLLESSGWRFFDDPEGKANIVLESNAKITEQDINALGENFEKTKKGFIDFLLLDENGFPVIVLEAKSEDSDPLNGKEQARKYARSQNVRFIILSNGNLHYFWDLEKGNPTVIISFPKPESITSFEKFKANPQKLIDERVEEAYIAETQLPGFKSDPRWIDDKQRAAFISEKNLKLLRPYQLRSIKALQHSVKKGNDRFLFEMATGTGKTLVSAALIKLFLRTGNARRILFLVDRIELERQAQKNFKQYLKNDYTSVVYKENKEEWRKAEIVVTTVQSLSIDNKYSKLFSPTDFDFIISDEAHRSISGNSRAVFEYFVGYKLGLTATPKDYIKNIALGKLNSKDVRSWERRQLLDTYKTFGCESGDPTFRYSLIDGVNDGWLINPIVIDARTEITTQMLSDKGYSIMQENEEGVEEENIFFQKDFEKKFFSEKTNAMFCETFIKNALRDPISGEIGKTIIFCVSQDHASKITQALNQYADQLFPGKYNSDFAVQVTSRITDSQDFTVSFANNNLNGYTIFLEGYKSSKTRICVTVSMMTTGYDCEDILNLCLLRPIFSPTNFVQIKGRGTRLYTFKHSVKDSNDTDKYEVKKENYKLFDFFANCEYFEKKFNYDEILKLPQFKGAVTVVGGGGKPKEEVIIAIPDPLQSLIETPIGLQGMKVDRKLYERFERTVKEDEFVKENYGKGDMSSVEEYIKNNIFNKPEDYFDLEKLRKSVKADRRISLREFIEKVFGTITEFKTKDELLEEEFDKFILVNKPESKYILTARNYFKSYVTDNSFKEIIDSRDFASLNTYPGFSMEEFKSLGKLKDIIPEYVKDYVSNNKFL